jgi:UDP-N-acetylglucosamine--N-acetylmuramyl-(pentapeptide) pyrophosphoryl-undecaprenol N-acetylglucosamine transferase
MRVLFACGGSAGHINPALATAGALRLVAAKPETLFVGTGRELEKKLVSAAGYALRSIPMNGLKRKLTPSGIRHNLKAAGLLMLAARRAGAVIDEFRPDIVVGTGGYICYPVLRAAAKRGIPCVLHESNAVPGLTTKLAAKYCARIYAAFPDFGKEFGYAEKVRVCPTPIMPGFASVTREKARRTLGFSDSERVVVSYFGSQGAGRMNEVVLDIVRRNAEERAFRHIHAFGGGEARLAEYKSRLPELPDYIDLRSYITDMPVVMAAADLVICRAGSSTLSELTALGAASVLIPSPYVPNDHQTKNALALEKSGAAVLLREKDATADALLKLTQSLLGDAERLAAIGKAARASGSADSAERFALELMSLTGK